MTEPDKIYVLNPCYQLRNDIHRIALFSKANANGNSVKEWHTFIHPAQAAMFSFFTHNRSYNENIRLLAAYFGKDTAYMEKTVSAYIKNPESVYTQWKEHKIIFPPNMLIEWEETGKDFSFRKLTPDLFVCQTPDFTSRRLYSGPLLITFMLTNRCVTRCNYCYADTTTRIDRALPTPRILELIQEAAELNVRQVHLMGGEIFLHKDWDIILKELVKLRIAPEFISTKIPPTAELIDKLRKTGYRNVLQVSLDACNEHILQETLSVSPSYLNEMMEGIRLLDRSGIPYQISSVLTTYNCNRTVMKILFDFLFTLKHLRDWRINPVSNSITIDYTEFVRLKARKAAIESIFDYIEESLCPTAPFSVLLNREAIKKEFYTCQGGSSRFQGSVCSALNTHLFILPDGQVTICEQLYWDSRFIIGDVNRSGLQEVWNSSQATRLVELSQQDIQEKSPCKSCSQFDTCFGYRNRCWSDIIKAYGKECWDFPDPRCEFAPAMKNKLGYE